MNEQAFARLLERVRAGDDDAVREFVDRFGPEIRRYISKHLRDPRLRRLFDTMDIWQSVLANFLVRATHDEFLLDDPEDLIKLLTRMALNKLRNKVKAQRTGKRDIEREEPADSARLDELASSDPSPSELIIFRDLLEAVRSRLPAFEWFLVEQRAQGRTWNEIAAEVDGSAESLRKQLCRALDRVKKEFGPIEGQP
jgi:RNA polymerase sigma factor (sigma-70 family)